MASTDSLKVRNLLSKGVVTSLRADSPVAITLKYVGTGTVTSVTTVTATSIELITSDGLTDTYDFATYATIGAIVDKINMDGIFVAKALDILRSAASDNNLLAEVSVAYTDARGNIVYDIHTDSSAFFQLGACLTPCRGFDAPKGHRVHLTGITYQAAVTTGVGIDNLQIWHRKNGVETQILGMLNVHDTLTTVTFAGGYGKITSEEDGEIIVLVKDATGLSDTAALIRVIGSIE